MQTDAEGLFLPVYQEQSCVGCHLCERVCPEKQDFPAREALPAFAAVAEDKAFVDSSLLLTPENWRSLMRKPKQAPEGAFVFSYQISYSAAATAMAKCMVRRLGAKPVIKHYIEPYSYYDEMGPREFLWHIAHAKSVLTHSFHGTVFSILMGTPFYSVASSAPQSCLTTLLETLGLRGRLLRSVGELPEKEQPFPSAEEMEAQLAPQRERSLDYLRRALSSVAGA